MAFLAAAAPVLAIAGAGISAIGTVEQGQATANASAYQAQVAQNNAIIAEQNATYASNAGLTQAAATSMKGAAAGGKVKAAQAASGIDVNTGSAVNVQASERETNVLNSETVLNNAELQAYGYRAAATGYKATAGLEEEEAAQAPVGAVLSATGNLLSAASSVGAKWPQPASQPLLGVSDQANPTAIGGLY
jgi:hypothetical protein